MPGTRSREAHSPRLGSSRRGLRWTDPRSRRRTLGLLAAVVVVVLFVIVPAYAAWRLFLTTDGPAVPAGRPVSVTVPAGAGTAEIATLLADNGVIANASLFRLRARFDRIDGRLRPGTYRLETGMAYRPVVDTLLAGPPLDFTTVTIPEGFTVEQIAQRLEEAAGIPAQDVLELGLRGAAEFAGEHPYLETAFNGSLEGYLFPKTYRVVEGSSARDVLEMMLDQFDTEIAALDRAYPTQRGLDLAQFVTLASMIEREARVASERPVVASVIYNRLERGMLLEIDATIEYVIKKNRPRLLNSDLEVDSPYNTYKNPGLPPGPISNPGLASLQAAASPAQTRFLYYVLTSTDGSHTFTETYEEFLEAKEKSREVVP